MANSSSVERDDLRIRVTRRLKEESIKGILALSALLSIFTTFSIIIVLFKESLTFFDHIGILEFLLGTNWSPLHEPRSFGVLPLVSGTLLIVIGSALIAIPMGLASAIYLSEYATDKVRSIIKPVLEILAGIPTVVYGYLALTFITPMLRWLIPGTEPFNAASAAIVVGIMILPMVASLCDDAIRAVPLSIRQAAYAVGATRYEVVMRVVVPGALSGIMAAFVLALSRAFGETMAVTLAAGAKPNLTANPFVSIMTMTAYIVNVSLGDTPAGGVEYQTIFAVGMLLFIITLAMNVIAQRIMRRFREVYE